MPEVVPGEGTLLKMKIAAAFVDVGQVVDMDPPEVGVNAVETTHLASTVHTRRASRLPDPKTFSFTLNFDPNDSAMHLVIIDRVKVVSGTDDEFEIWFNDGNTTRAKLGFTGFFTKAKPAGVEVESNLTAECEVQLTSLVTTTPGTP